jgi:catechol 2,3-dioxygenase-like lactoylglutathione lyase family enzyme
VILDLMSPGVEIGLVTTNLAAMVDFYEGFLGLPLQGEIAFADGSQRRYALGDNVLKLVTYTSPRVLPVTPGGGHAQAGMRYFTVGVHNLREVAAKVDAAGYTIAEPPTEFAPVPGMGWMFIADPDGNAIELFGTL